MDMITLTTGWLRVLVYFTFQFVRRQYYNKAECPGEFGMTATWLSRV